MGKGIGAQTLNKKEGTRNGYPSKLRVFEILFLMGSN